MRGGYWYIEGANDRLFCWSKVPSFSCPFAEGAPVFLTDAVESAVEGWAGSPDPAKLNEMWTRAHQNGFSHDGLRARDEEGKLTDRCQTCGAQLDRKGFAAWEERPRDADDPKARIATRLGFSSHERVGETRYFRTKRQAEAWARRSADRGKVTA